MTDAGVPPGPDVGTGPAGSTVRPDVPRAATPGVPRTASRVAPRAPRGGEAAAGVSGARPKLPRPEVTPEVTSPSPARAGADGGAAVARPPVDRGAAAGLDAVAVALQAEAEQRGTVPPAPDGAPAGSPAVGVDGEGSSDSAPPRPAPSPMRSSTAPAAPVEADADRAGGSGSPLSELVAPAATRTTRTGLRRPRSPFWAIGFPIVMVLIVLAIPMLLLAGRKTVLQSTDGKILTEVTDPAQPNWQALTDPTPTMLLVQTDDAGKPIGLTVVSLTGDGAGGLIFVPMTAVLELPDIGRLPLNLVAEKAGIDGLQKAVEGILGAGMTEVRAVSPQQWADLVAPVGPITVANPDDVLVADASGQKRVRFPKGQLTLQPADVAAYLSTTSPGESDLNRLVRQKVFWDAYLRKVGASADPNVVPGEKDSGLGRFIRTLADDRVEMFPLPVQGVAIPGSTAALYLPVKDQVSSLVARLVPFPIGAPPGARPRVRLLDGTGKLDHGLAAAPLIVEGGGQIDQIGNGPTFDLAKTQLVYYDEGQRPAVEQLQKTLGLGDIVKGTSAGSAVDVTVTLGRDYLAQPARGLAPVSTVPNGTATSTIVGAGG